MRRSATHSILLLSIVLSLASCSKKEQQGLVLATPEPQEINATIASNATYELPLEKYGTVKIHRQASNFLQSTTGMDSKKGIMVYKYVPAPGFIGDDLVVLSSTKTFIASSNGNGCNRGSTYSNSASNMTTSTSYVTVKLKVIK